MLGESNTNKGSKVSLIPLWVDMLDSGISSIFQFRSFYWTALRGECKLSEGWLYSPKCKALLAMDSKWEETVGCKLHVKSFDLSSMMEG